MADIATRKVVKSIDTVNILQDFSVEFQYLNFRSATPSDCYNLRELEEKQTRNTQEKSR